MLQGENMRLLIIEDNKELNNMIKIFITREGFSVIQAYSKEEGLVSFYEKKPDIIILDLNLPDGNGLDICSEIKGISQVPILILTANSSLDDEILGLKSGADDYISKPFNFEILNLRLKALVRKNSVEEIKMSSTLKVFPKEFKVFLEEEVVKLSPKEYDLLLFLWENKERVTSRESIINHIWGFDYYGDFRTVDTHINRLKKKIVGSKIIIENKRGRGYRLKDED